MDETIRLKKQIELLKEEIESLEETCKEVYELRQQLKNWSDSCMGYMRLAEKHSKTIRRMIRERSDELRG